MVTATRLVVSVPDAGLEQLLGDLPKGVEIITWDMSGPAPVDHIDIVVPPYLVGPEVLDQLTTVTVRLVQSPMLGYDGVEARLPPGQVYANAASVHETSTAEMTLALILASQRGIPDFVRAAERGKWERAWRPSLADRSVLIIGYGGVGTAIEERIVPFEVSVVRVARRARRDDRGEIHAMSEVNDLLPLADVVVLAVPLTEETTHLANDEFLSRMQDGSLLVNIARGRVADTEAILQHATNGRLRFALDVTDPEPLPDGHPLFALPNVLISPHVGGATSAAFPRLARLVHEQIERLLRGEEPRNVVLRT
jgi:phosphoglycerate dehydrogenase-like enzyme